MKRRAVLKELAVGDTCETDLLLLRMKQRTTAAKGTPFVEAVLTDGDTVITARKFNARKETLEKNGVVAETIVRTVLTVDLYNGGKSYIVCDIWAEGYPSDYKKFFQHKPLINIDQAFSKLIALIRLNSGTYTNAYAPVGRLAEQVLTSNQAAFCHSAGGESKHHNRIGGLLEHSLGVSTEASRIAEHHAELDRELLVAGSALHDIGKIHELYTSPFGLIERAESNLTGGHPVIGMNMIDDALDASNMSFDPERVRLLKHIIGAHHGHPGSSGTLYPATAEARIVQLLDAMDATLDCVSVRNVLAHPSADDSRRGIEQAAIDITDKAA